MCGVGTRGRQYHNRDDGYGLCVSCGEEINARCAETGSTETAEYLAGKRGFHWDVRCARCGQEDGTHECLPKALQLCEVSDERLCALWLVRGWSLRRRPGGWVVEHPRLGALRTVLPDDRGLPVLDEPVRRAMRRALEGS